MLERVLLAASCWLLTVSAGAASAPETPWRSAVGRGQLQVQPDGQWRLLRDGQPVVRNAHLVIAAPRWKGSVDQSNSQLLPATSDAAPRHEPGSVAIESTLREPSSQAVWQLRETIAATAAGWRMVYEVRPRRAVDAGEIALFIDLPIKLWNGAPIVVWPLGESRFPPQRPADRHFFSGPARSIGLGDGPSGQLTLRLRTIAQCTFQDMREYQGDVYQLYVQLHSGGPVAAGSTLRLEFELRPADAEPIAVPTVRLAAADRLQIKQVSPGPPQVAQGSRWTLRADVSGTYRTPFDPQQMAVDAHFVAPSGRTIDVPAFFTQEYRRQTEDGLSYIEPQGTPGWEVRFTPVEAGRYRFWLTARDNSGEVRSADGSFVSQAAAWPGFIRVSRRDNRYFEFDDGRPYFAVGENTAACHEGGRQSPLAAGGIDQFERWFGKLGAAGGNYGRVWMCSPSLGIEWGPPGVYRLDQAWQLDRVLEAAQRHGIYVKLCLESWRGFAGPGSFVRPGDVHPYCKANGGPCQREIEVFTDPEALRMFHNRLRYVVARWGWLPNIFGWEFWNEINCVRGYDADVVARWTQDMACYLKQIDPWRHLVVNSLGSFVVDDRYWRLPEIDFAQVHGYWHPRDPHSRESGRDMGAFVPYWIDQIRGHGKPALFAEFGLVANDWGLSPLAAQDREGIHLHNGLWSAMMAGGAGTAMTWWWDNYVDALDLYGQFRGVADFARDVPWTTAHFEPVRGRSEDPKLRVLALRGRDQLLAWLQNTDHTWSNAVEGRPMGTITQATAVIAGVPPGDWQVQWWDTWQGRTLRTQTLHVADDGQLKLAVSELASDVALKACKVARP